ncbi:taperin [Mixophyes fleayi]|uniref:taperin n=1 Tax=Mixophyes fleayi TaxID=3061075 RepID=UPI003F4D773D
MAVSGGTSSWARLEPHPGKMPAWKLEVLERKRAKMASAAAPLSRGKDGSPSRRTRSPSGKGSPERMVLQDSLGPLHDNPFIRLEKERRRRRPQNYHPGRATSPIRHLLDMYGNVPGIRTIRAENIIIIESDPGYFNQPTPHTDPVEELLAKRGSKVTEIRASEVVIYEPEPPRKAQEPLRNTQEPPRKAHDPQRKVQEPPKKVQDPHRKVMDPPKKAQEPPKKAHDPHKKAQDPPKRVQAPPHNESLEHSEVLEEAGRVSRLMEKFDHGHGKPVRSRSWENLLERDCKPPSLPKPPTAERHGQVPQNRVPKRSGDISPSSASLLDEDSKRFPLNNPSWLPSKQPVVHSLPDPGQFQKMPSSPVTSPVSNTPPSPSFFKGPLSPSYEITTDEKCVSPIVATFREKFEAGHTSNNLPLLKLMNVAQKTGSNTMIVNPKAASANKARPETTDPPLLTNGHVDPSDLNSKAGSSIKIQDLLSKSKRPRGTKVQRPSEGSGLVPSSSDSSNEIPKGAKTWKPKSEVENPKTNSPPKSSATQSEISLHNHCDQAFTSATPSQQLKVSSSTSSNDSFEIKPAPKPDLNSIPDDDIQAKALANIRMQSKNSFVFIPKKRQAPSEPPKKGSVVQNSINEKPKVKNSASTVNGPKVDFTDSAKNGKWSNEGPASTKLQEVAVNGDDRLEWTVNSMTVQASNVPSLSDFDWKSGLLPSSSSTESLSFTDPGAKFEYFSSAHQGDDVNVLTVPVTNLHEDIVKADIPVTNIDDIVNIEDQGVKKEAKPALKTTDSSTTSYRPHAPLSSVHGKGSNTFTVVPKRKPVTEQEAFRSPLVDDDDDDEATSKRKSSDGSEAPYTDLGLLLKKRYPTVDEIQVIGGYLSLSRSCLLKNDSTRKKMKISFNEQNIHTMFEYPSENSLAEEEGDDLSNSESDDEDKPVAFFLPRPSFVSGGASSNSLRANSANSGLSNYTPKHSMEYSKWQDEKPEGGPASPVGNADREDMLTPADNSSHTDFRSEPALYF